MSSSTYNLSNMLSRPIPDASDMRFGIVVSEWNDHITQNLLDGTIETLKQYGAKDEKIIVKSVPGSFELVFGCSQLAKSGLVDGIVAIGCVIRGDTPHFDYICSGATQGLVELNQHGNIPVVFGLLTTSSLQQAEERSGGILGNKGNEYAVTAIKMIEYARSIKK
ncbi:MAG TPA: 6,7-dimethyl-8-ribityllumazine synthase [Prevotellaceae bacterium]|mgnify:FL=1|nr:6,7-dimethyl-8-ribityllumazine synthase [Prevotellaceae bacterium]